MFLCFIYKIMSVESSSLRALTRYQYWLLPFSPTLIADIGVLSLICSNLVSHHLLDQLSPTWPVETYFSCKSLPQLVKWLSLNWSTGFIANQMAASSFESVDVLLHQITSFKAVINIQVSSSNNTLGIHKPSPQSRPHI